MADGSPHTVSCLLRMKIPPKVPARAQKRCLTSLTDVLCLSLSESKGPISHLRKVTHLSLSPGRNWIILGFADGWLA